MLANLRPGANAANDLNLARLGNYVPQSSGNGLLSRLLTETWPARATGSILDALKLPGQVAGGILNVKPENPGYWSDMDEARQQATYDTMINRATDLAGLAMLGSTGAPMGALGAGPAGLRARYATYLREAAGGKDPMRIKLTPERVEAAKELYQNWRANYGLGPEPAFGTTSSPYRVTEQSNAAIDFAEAAKRAGQDVRVKYPDGSHGSVYVRVGDEGTVRFADHYPATEGGKIVGGYSKTLGRRHHPATVDVSKPRYGNIDPAPAYDWLTRKLE